MNGNNEPSERCGETGRLLDSYLGNELPEEQAREVHNHLEGCARCSLLASNIQRIRESLKRSVERETAPPHLREAIVHRIAGEAARPKILQFHVLPRWSYAVAAALLVLVLGWGVLRLTTPDPSPDRGTLAELSQTEGILKIGMGDHIFCAVRHHNDERAQDVEQMVKGLGPTYAGLLPVMRENLHDFNVVVAHTCSFEGRRFIHLILRRDGRIVSLAITRKQRESFRAAGSHPAAEVSGIPLFQARLQELQEYQVTGFETDRFLAFLVSDLDGASNLRIASSIAPDVGRFLSGIPG